MCVFRVTGTGKSSRRQAVSVVEGVVKESDERVTHIQLSYHSLSSSLASLHAFHLHCPPSLQLSLSYFFTSPFPRNVSLLLPSSTFNQLPCPSFFPVLSPPAVNSVPDIFKSKVISFLHVFGPPLGSSISEPSKEDIQLLVSFRSFL